MPTDINIRLDFLSTSGELLSFTDCVAQQLSGEAASMSLGELIVKDSLS
jgi:hypothetical protein